MQIVHIHQRNSGFTLVEMLVSFTIFAGIAFIIGMFIKTIFDYQLLFTQQLTAQQQIEMAFTTMIPEIRAMAPSALGGYPIAHAATSSLTFFTDIDTNGVVDQVRYFLSGTTLYKGIIVPRGNPSVYYAEDEVVTEVVHHVVASVPMFTFYNAQYTGSEAAMIYPLAIADIRVIKVLLTVLDPNRTTSFSSTIEIVPRNIRTNL